MPFWQASEGFCGERHYSGDRSNIDQQRIMLREMNKHVAAIMHERPVFALLMSQPAGPVVSSDALSKACNHCCTCIFDFEVRCCL